MFADSNGLVRSCKLRILNRPGRVGMYLLDQHVEILRYLRCEAYRIDVTPSVFKTKQRQNGNPWRYTMCMQWNAEVLCHESNDHTVGLENAKDLVACSTSAVRALMDRAQYTPVTTLTCATPCESRRTTPICEGVAPFFASLQIWSTTCSGVVLSQAGGVREYGIALAEMPFPLL